MSLHSGTSNRTEIEPIHLLYDERMLLHRPVQWEEPEVYPEFLSEETCEDYVCENPERLRVIYKRLCHLEHRLVHEEDDFSPMIAWPNDSDGEVFHRLQCQMATRDQILLAHDRSYYDKLARLETMSDEALLALSQGAQDDVYYCRETFAAARLAAGGLLACVDAVCDASATKTSNKSLALVRPPGHHACQSQEMGFCFIDSVVVAAKYALREGKAKRVVILDWDIHDGNGTAESTLADDNIFRIDLHRIGFYPFTGPASQYGTGAAKGLNLNVGWSNAGMGNTEYAAAFYELVLPLLAEYQPDLLIISCGLDAAMGDLLGGCELTPGFFHAMTRATLEAVGPECPVVCALEGGYAISVIPDCMEAVTLAMLHCPFSYHSSDLFGCGGAASENASWPYGRLERSRRVLSKYYIRGGCSRLLESAINDINTSIRIFKGLARWKHLNLHRIKGLNKGSWNPKMVGQVGKKRGYCATSANGERPLQRPRIYLWYGTEWHHHRYW